VPLPLTFKPCVVKKILLLMLLLPLQALAQRDNVLIDCNFDSGKVPAKINAQKCCDYSQIFTTDTTRYGTGKALRFEARSTDPLVANHIRSELAENGENATEQWYGYSTFVPNSFVSDTIKVLVSQWHARPDAGESGRIPPIYLKIQNDHYYINILWSALPFNSDNNGHTIDDGSFTADLGAVAKNQWADWVWHIKFSYGNYGLIECWQNGKLIFSRHGPNSYNDKATPYFKCGLYIPTWSNGIVTPGITKRIIYFDELWISGAIPSPSSNATLGKLLMSSGTVSPAFSPAVTSYKATVDNDVSAITITPVTNNIYTTVQVNGKTVSPGQPSGKVPLAVGPNTVTTVVKAQDGTTKTYTITVTRPSTNAHLAGLTISHGTLTPAFAEGVTDYTDTVSNATQSISVTPSTASMYATVKVNGTAVTSGTASKSVSLNVGVKQIKVAVKSQSGALRNYIIMVKRLPAGTKANAFNSDVAITDTIKPAATSTVLSTKIYPNPSIGSFNLKILNGDNNSTATIKIRNLEGKVIFQTYGSANDTYTFGQEFATGIYIVDIQNGTLNKQVKIIKAAN
jgi:hypothetical protein